MLTTHAVGDKFNCQMMCINIFICSVYLAYLELTPSLWLNLLAIATL